jgi:hypothetical protein
LDSDSPPKLVSLTGVPRTDDHGELLYALDDRGNLWVADLDDPHDPQEHTEPHFVLAFPSYRTYDSDGNPVPAP